MNKKKKAYPFYQDLYHQEFLFLPEWSESEIYELFGESMKNADGAAFIHNGIVCIWLRKFDFKSFSALAHESVHGANMLFSLRGQESDVRNDEAQAYLVQWIFEKCIKHFKLKK
jgi:hypothetical protein